MKRMQKKILILGAGTSATMLANDLASKLHKEILNGEISVEVLAENIYHTFQPANLDVAFKGANPGDFVKSEISLLNARVEYVVDAASKISLESNKVTTVSGKEVNYDYLVIATGSVADPSLLEGLEESSLNFHTGPFNAHKIWTAINELKSGTVVISIAGVPHKCPPSPIEASFLLDEFLRRKNLRNDVKIILTTPYARPYSAEPISEVVEPRLKKKGIEIMTFFNVSRVDPQAKKVYSMEGDDVSYDLLIAIPPHRGAKAVIDSGIGGKYGWVPTERDTLQIKGFENAFAMGDATDIPVSKSGVVAHLESEVVSENIIALLRNTGKLVAYNGRINCPMEVGNRHGLFVSATYTSQTQKQTPSILKYVMKKAFGIAYWVVLSGKLNIIMSLYFGKTHYPKVEGEQQAPVS